MDDVKPHKILVTLLSWSDLPKELLVSITNLLHDDDDIIRMRAVCSPWRLSIVPPRKISPYPLTLPVYNVCTAASARRNFASFKLSTATICHLKLPGAPPLYSMNRKEWLVRVVERENGESIVLNPFGGRIDLFSPQANTKVLNSLEFHISEMAKGFSLQLVNMKNDVHYSIVEELTNICQHGKVCVSSKPISAAGNDYAVMLVNKDKCLHHIKSGDKKWTASMRRINILNDLIKGSDVMEYQGYFYVVNNFPIVLKLDYSFHVVENQMAPVCEHCPCTLRLVECRGNLLLVHKCLDMTDSKPFKIKVFKINGSYPVEWQEMKDLGDDVLFICHDCCFSVSAKDFKGLKGNCIYFMDSFQWEFGNDAICKGLNDSPIYVFYLEDGSVGPLLSHPDNPSILWSVPC
ncbi:hypothetical protein ACFE04_002501 [Oxalis oulophora]